MQKTYHIAGGPALGSGPQKTPLLPDIRRRGADFFAVRSVSHALFLIAVVALLVAVAVIALSLTVAVVALVSVVAFILFIAVIALSFIAIVLGVLFSLCPRVFEVNGWLLNFRLFRFEVNGFFSFRAGRFFIGRGLFFLGDRNAMFFRPPGLLAPGILDGPI